MTTPSIKTQAANLFANTTGNANGKGKQIGNGFDLFINNSLKTTKDSNDNVQTQSVKGSAVKNNNQNSVKDDDTDSKALSDVQKTSYTSKSDASKATNQSAATQDDNNTVTDIDDVSTKDQEDALAENQQLMAEIAGMLQAVQEAAMKALNLSSEELNQLLSEQGMSLTDLLQPEKLQQLVLAGNGTTDILSALTDENLADTLKQLTQAVEGIKDSSNLDLSAEQIKSLLEKAKELYSSQEEDLKQQNVASSEISAGDTQQTALTEENNTMQNVTTDNKELTVGSDSEKNMTTQVNKPSNEETFHGSQSHSDHKTGDDMNTKDQFQVFVDNLVNATHTVRNEFANDMAQVTQLREIVNQIVERIKVTINPGQTSMELQLNPENLGKVNLTVQSKNGMMTAQFVVQNEVSKQAIESQMQTLRDSLSQQGIKIEAIEVTVSANAFDQNYNQPSNNQEETQKNQSGRKISLEDAINMTDFIEEESGIEDIAGVTGSQINYTA